MRLFRRAALVFWVAASLAVELAAQGLTGQISGSIVDPTAAAVSAATIEIRNTETRNSESS